MAVAKKPPTTPIRIFEQIEDTAGFYGPEVYDLLSRQNVLKTEADPLGPDFIPLTTVRPRNKQDAKMFVVGILPPSANVTGRLLDRSATVAAIQGIGEAGASVTDSFAASLNAPMDPATQIGAKTSSVPRSKIVTMPGYQIPANTAPFNPGAAYTTAGVTEPTPTITQLNRLQVYQAIYDAYSRKFGRPPTVTECWIYTAQSIRETSGNWPNNNPGYIGNFPQYKPGTFSAESQTGGKDKGYYVSYPTVEAGADAFVRKLTGNANIVQAAQSGDVLGYVTSMAQSGYYGAPIKVYYDPFRAIMRDVAGALQKAGAPPFPPVNLPPAPATCGFTEDIFRYQERVGLRQGGKFINRTDVGLFRALSNSNYDGCPLLPDGTAAGPETSWQGTGSDNAQQAKKASVTLAARDLNQTELGQQLAAQQKAQIRALQQAIEQMANTPPLRMLVNPSSFKVAAEKVVNDGSRSRERVIVEHWGEAQDKLSGSGKIAGFYAMDAAGTALGSSGNSPGLTRMARNFSASYQNFLSLYLIYKNNGGVWIDDLGDPTTSRPNNLSLVGSVYIYYDNTLYVGSFDSFNVNESDEKPFTLEYDFEFTVRATFLLDPVVDPRISTGATDSFGKSLGKQTIPSSRETLIGDTGVFGRTMSDAELAAFEEQLIRQGEIAAREQELAPKDPGNIFADPPLSNSELAAQLFPKDPKRVAAVAAASRGSIVIAPPKKK